MRDTVLCVTHGADVFTIDRVMAALIEKGVRPVRLNTDRFPTEVKLATYPRRNEFFFDLGADGTVATADIGAVWMRKFFPPAFGPNLDEQYKAGCVRESAEALRTTLDMLRHVPWIDRLDLQRAGENKLRQLKLARQVGLITPETLVSNDPDKVRDFYSACGGNMVTKMLTPFTVSMDGNSPFVYTSVVTEADLEDLSGLTYAPMVFQRNIPKDHELRVAFVDGAAFAGTTHVTQSQAGETDWRRARSVENPWRAGSLPESVREKASALMTELGLVFGALDFIVTPEGEYVFLEVNPAGEWGMLEKFAGLPISEAIAEALVTRMKA